MENSQRPHFRIGLGHDTHRLTEGNGMFLGGVRIDYHRALHGHSDADVLLHSVADALLGASGLGDIGEFFPDTDPSNRNKDSAEMLRIIWKEIRSMNWRIVNLDIVLFAEKPKITPYKSAIKNRIAEILEITPEQVSIKAKTGEKVGFIGREEAISAESIVLIERS